MSETFDVKQAFERMESLLKQTIRKVNSLEIKIDDLYEEEADDQQHHRQQPSHTGPSDDLIKDIIQYGDAIPYRKFIGRHAEQFKEFIRYILDNESRFNEMEVQYAEYANKRFNDLRLSNNSFKVLGGAYRKIYGRDLPFRFIHGTMYKYANQIHWVWDTETP